MVPPLSLYEMPAIRSNLIWLLSHVELEANGKPVECLWCVPTGTTFHVQHIGELIVTPDMLAAAVANFQARDRVPPRVPIQVNHAGFSGNIQEAKAVGWIVDLAVAQTNERVSLMFTPHWSDEAKEVIEAGGFRYVSVGMQMAAIDAVTGESIGPRLVEVSLTGSPAIPDLHPIELALDLESKVKTTAVRLAADMDGEMDMLDCARQIATAFFAAYPDTDGCMWMIEAVFYEAKQMVVEECLRQVTGDGVGNMERLWQLSFTMDDESHAVTFAPREEWERVKHQFVPVEMPEDKMPEEMPKEMKASTKNAAAISSTGNGNPPEAGGAAKEKHMELTKIVEMLGLSEGADEAAVQAEVARLRGVEQASKDAQKLADEAGKQLSERDRKIVTLSEKADASAEQVTQMSVRIKGLEDEKNLREAESAIDKGLQSGKLTASEVDGADAPMRMLAMSNRGTFQAILDKRPASNLTKELSLAGEQTTEVNQDEFWQLVRAKRDTDPELKSADAQAIVLRERPEFQVLIQAAHEFVTAQRSKGK